MKKICTILGARPQFIKAAAVSLAFQKSGRVEEVIIHTGQHYDYKLSDLLFEELNIREPERNLNVGSGSHGEQTGKMLALIEQELMRIKPDMVLVYGDTNSTLAGSLAASKLHIPIAHVEAGLRSFNRIMPEEINRVVTDQLSDFLFAPTTVAADNLKAEGTKESRIHMVGDVMLDAIHQFQKVSEAKSSVMASLGLNGEPFILATIHRAENTDNPERLAKILKFLNEISQSKKIVFPVHPRTRVFLKEMKFSPGLLITEPVGYLDMLALQRGCRLIVTDSGGVQKEAFINKKYCITVREETEWTELVDKGFNFLADPIESAAGHVEKLWTKPFEDKGFKPYGDGTASEKIVRVITENI